MKNLLFIPAFLTIILVACSLPNTEKPIALMEQYWKFYGKQQYDSLGNFYVSELRQPENLTELFQQIKKNDDRFGKPVEISLISTSAESSLGKGSSIKLEYQVVYENAKFVHHFSFKEEEGVNKILEHSIEL